jgi:hypothetical protein
MTHYLYCVTAPRLGLDGRALRSVWVVHAVVALAHAARPRPALAAEAPVILARYIGGLRTQETRDAAPLVAGKA